MTPFLILTSKMCWHRSKDDWLETIFLYNYIEFHLIPFTQGVNHLHTLYRNEIIVISKMSNFYDIIVKIWRPDYVTSVFTSYLEIINLTKFHHSSSIIKGHYMLFLVCGTTPPLILNPTMSKHWYPKPLRCINHLS